MLFETEGGFLSFCVVDRAFERVVSVLVLRAACNEQIGTQRLRWLTELSVCLAGCMARPETPTRAGWMDRQWMIEGAGAI